MKKILIISYTFPPTPGIGGRRWAKFAKYLYRKGHDVRVIAAEVPYTQKSNWCGDIEQLQKDNHITYIPSGYPKVMYRSRTILDKIFYRVALAYLKLTTKGYYYDPSTKWEQYLIPTIEQHIEQGYRDIIATGAPFGYLTSLPKLKEKFSDIKLVADLRDPWIDNHITYSYKNLTSRRLYFEKRAEKSVVENFDYIVSVYEEMSEYFSTLSECKSDKFITISNGFDKDDIALPIESEEKKSSKVRCIYIGTLYPKIATAVAELVACLDSIKATNSSLYDRLLFDFYGYVDDQFARILSRHPQAIQLHGYVGLDSIAVALHQSDATMIFLTPEIDYYFITKMYDCMQIRKPIILFAQGGKIVEFIEANRLGFIAKDIQKDLPMILEKISKGYQVNQEFDISQFDIENLADKIVELLE